MRRGRLILLFLALILLVGAVGGYFLLSGAGSPTTPEGEPVEEVVRDAEVVIAAQEIPRGAKIQPDALLTSTIPSDMVVETMVQELGEVVGRRARMDIPRGVIMTKNMITDSAGDLLGTGSDASLAIPAGFTAISIPMNRLSSVAYAVKDGDSVDVLITMLVSEIDRDFQSLLPNRSVVLFGRAGVVTGVVASGMDAEGGPVLGAEPMPVGRAEADPSSGETLYVEAAERQRPRMVTQRLIEKATVLHVGTYTFEGEVLATDVATTGEEEGGEAGSTTVVVRPPDVITLIVTPQDALALNYAMKSGAIDINLTLRGPGDPTQEQTDSVTLEYLFENYGIPKPAKLDYGLEPRLDAIKPPILPNDQPVSSE